MTKSFSKKSNQSCMRLPKTPSFNAISDLKDALTQNILKFNDEFDTARMDQNNDHEDRESKDEQIYICSLSGSSSNFLSTRNRILKTKVSK